MARKRIRTKRFEQVTPKGKPAKTVFIPESKLLAMELVSYFNIA